MFGPFYADAREAVALARREAIRQGQGSIGCGHLLLGVLAAGHGPGAQALFAAGVDPARVRASIVGPTLPPSEPLDAEALASLGIDLDAVRRATEAAFGPGALDRTQTAGRGGDRRLGGIRLNAQTKKAIELALRTTSKLRGGHISTGHLLIGIIDQGENDALAALTAAGADTAALRADVVARIAAAA
jgi:hypothetical protein